LREFQPHAFDGINVGYATQDTVCSNLTSNTSDFQAESTKRVHHGVDDLLELDHDLAFDSDGDLLSEVTPSDGTADQGDVLNLGPEQSELIDGLLA
jgi:hypothetical protein